MTKILIQSFLHVLILFPLVILFLKEKTKLNFQRIFVFLFVMLFMKLLNFYQELIQLLI